MWRNGRREGERNYSYFSKGTEIKPNSGQLLWKKSQPSGSDAKKRCTAYKKIKKPKTKRKKCEQKNQEHFLSKRSRNKARKVVEIQTK